MVHTISCVGDNNKENEEDAGQDTFSFRDDVVIDANPHPNVGPQAEHGGDGEHPVISNQLQLVLGLALVTADSDDGHATDHEQVEGG